MNPRLGQSAGAVQSSGTRPAHSARATRNNDSDAGPSQTDNGVIAEVAALKTLTGQLEQLADQMIEDVVAEPTIPPQVDEDAIAEVAALKILTEQLGQLADQVTEDVIAEPTIPQHSTAGQSERTDDALALVQQEQEPQVVNEHEEQSNSSKAANEDFDDLMLIVVELSDFPVKDLDIMWNQLSENSQHRTAEQWERLYTDQVLPTHKAQQLIALMKKRKLNGLMPGTAKRATASSKELDQPTGTAVSMVVRQNTKDIRVPSQVAHVTQGQIGTQINAIPKTDDNGHQSCINGILRFKDCKTVNIACNEPESNGTLVPRKLITGEMIFEGCEDVNILVSQDLVPSSAKVQHRSRKNTQHPAQPACVNARPQVPQEQPVQDPPQVAHQAPPVMQHVGAEAHPAAQPYGQSRPPQLLAQAQSYGPPPPPPQTCGQDRPQPYGQPGPPMQLPPLTTHMVHLRCITRMTTRMTHSGRRPIKEGQSRLNTMLLNISLKFILTMDFRRFCRGSLSLHVSNSRK
jgi:hypothetical protein